MEQCFLYNRCNHVHCGDSFCMRRYKMERIYAKSLMSEKQREPIQLYQDKSGVDAIAFGKLAECCAGIEDFVAAGKNLYIHSDICGNGKTSWALKLLNCYANKAWPNSNGECVILFVSVPRLLLALKENISSKNDYAQFVLDHYLEADLVVWDDIAAKMATQFENDNLLRLINDRIYEGKSNIYTSNLSMLGLSQALDERLASRIKGSMEIELKGQDKRRLAIILEEQKNAKSGTGNQ